MSYPINPPQEWFSPPESGIPTDKRITVEPTGRVYGYIALWNTCHVGHAGCVRPPKGSPSDYEYAHQGETLTEEGDLIKTAVIAGGAKHAPVDMKTANVPEYYENTGTQLMRVRYGEDDNGLYFAGALWPGVEELEVAQIRASSISGDWRFHAAWRKSGGQYDFAGACFVNIPGFPMPAKGGNTSYSGTPYALAASAFMPLDQESEYVFLSPEPTEHVITATGEEQMECDGNCTDCTCGKTEVEEETEVIDEESAEEILLAAYQLIGKKLKKKPATIKADMEMLNSDAENQIQIGDLNELVRSIKDAVDWLVADKLISEIVEETDTEDTNEE